MAAARGARELSTAHLRWFTEKHFPMASVVGPKARPALVAAASRVKVSRLENVFRFYESLHADPMQAIMMQPQILRYDVETFWNMGDQRRPWAWRMRNLSSMFDASDRELGRIINRCPSLVWHLSHTLRDKARFFSVIGIPWDKNLNFWANNPSCLLLDPFQVYQKTVALPLLGYPADFHHHCPKVIQFGLTTRIQPRLRFVRDELGCDPAQLGSSPLSRRVLMTSDPQFMPVCEIIPYDKDRIRLTKDSYNQFRKSHRSWILPEDWVDRVPQHDPALWDEAFRGNKMILRRLWETYMHAQRLREFNRLLAADEDPMKILPSVYGGFYRNGKPIKKRAAIPRKRDLFLLPWGQEETSWRHPTT